MHDASDVDLERLRRCSRLPSRDLERRQNDGFNRLLLAAGLELREVVVLRAYCRYLLQTGLPFSQLLMERVLANHATITRQLRTTLSEVRFQLDIGAKTRDKEMARFDRAIVKALTGVRSADDDRILRAYLRAIRATLRTNFHQTPRRWWLGNHGCHSFDPQRLPDQRCRGRSSRSCLQSAGRGVHLRMGFVARGGIRWSDRREDFRTEVLGLMKAQNVKNTLIVPVGHRGFFPKRLPHGGSRDDVQREVIASYRTFIRGLLDVTDNIVGGKVVPRDCLVRHDGDDAYLVVAADKGTATFSTSPMRSPSNTASGLAMHLPPGLGWL
ncbi:MAG: NAD-glutamate dehydrogenase [Planctomycetes bacterium]|nr:NAD-glutamate dehydrogenase [Planctomycetota bacterium]